MKKPYIGITDFTNFLQVEYMQRVFKAHLPPEHERRLHVGVMMSRNSLLHLPRQYKWETPIIEPEQVPDIFENPEVMNCIHFADPKWREDFEFEKRLYQVLESGGSGINALQLDLDFPDPTAIANAVHASRKRIEVVLQVSGEILKGDPLALIEKLEDYEEIVDYVLFDQSRGRGVPLRSDLLTPYLRAVQEAFPALGLVVGGGLGPSSMHLLGELLQEFPDISWDAQGKLRPSGSYLDPIDWTMAGAYLERSLGLFR